MYISVEDLLKVLFSWKGFFYKSVCFVYKTFLYPNVFDITMFNEDQTHRIARSCLSSIQVDHSGAGVNSTFYDDYPVETNLNLVFTELEILHKEKIDQGY